VVLLSIAESAIFELVIFTNSTKSQVVAKNYLKSDLLHNSSVKFFTVLFLIVLVNKNIFW